MTTPIAQVQTQPPHRGCPVDHGALSETKTMRRNAHAKAVEQDAVGRWHVYGYAEARAFLRAEGTRQAGFRAERIDKLPQTMRDPILYQEGDAHREQRTKTARFFTPKTTDDKYRDFMEAFADEVLADFLAAGRADLSDLSMQMAVQVAAQVVGLTNSRRPGMNRRIEAFFEEPAADAPRFVRLRDWLRGQVSVGRFFFLDVQPAIRARRTEPREDVISHTLKEGYSPTEILTECVTYAAAGMVTTREFISVAAWHLLEHSALRQSYLASEQGERYSILHEILRLEPVVGTLFRRVTEAVVLESDGERITIPAGAQVSLHIGAANTDEAVVGDAPLAACPARGLPRGVPEPVLSFGDGHHRCPGAYVAIQESDIFLRKFLALPGLRVLRQPDLGFNDVVQGYELRNFMMAVG
ncbi:cytochrome P450 [soil metagenome]